MAGFVVVLPLLAPARNIQHSPSVEARSKSALKGSQLEL
jgi:hypothetical protein